MKVWIDALTPKQLIFFDAVSRRLARSGHEVIATTRDYHDATYVVRRLRLEANVVGKHGGATLRGKLDASLERARELVKFVTASKFDLALSFSSPEAARVAFGLGIPHLAVNDSPHAVAVAKLTLPLSRLLFAPYVIPFSAWRGFGISKEDIRMYKAIDPAAWLKHPERWPEPNEVERQATGAIVVRLEESQASYLLKQRTDAVKTIESLSDAFPHMKLLLLARYGEQEKRYSQLTRANVHVCASPFFGANMVRRAALFVGRGGTMNAEAALLGVPTISNYPGEKTFVDSFLLKSGLMAYADSDRALVRVAMKLLDDKSRTKELKKRTKRLLQEMEDPSDVIAQVIDELNE